MGTKRHILTDKKRIPLSVVITSASTHDVKTVTDVIDKTVIKQPMSFLYTIKRKRRKQCQHLYLDRAYSSKSIENKIIKRGYVPPILYKRKRGHVRKNTNKKRYYQSKNKRWVVERGQTLGGITDSKRCLQSMKRRLKIILVWCISAL
jgi:hypothetical protein